MQELLLTYYQVTAEKYDWNYCNTNGLNIQNFRSNKQFWILQDCSRIMILYLSELISMSTSEYTT